MFRWFARRLDLARHNARRAAANPAHALGHRGEDLAHRYLQDNGLIVTDRNWTTLNGLGELDIVAWDGDTLVFVEVKSRANDEYGDPGRAVNRVKRMAMAHAARWYSRLIGVPPWRCRHDLVTVVFNNPPVIQHYRGHLLAPRPDEVS